MNAVTQSSQPLTSAALRNLQVVLESAGWSLRCFELNLHAERVKIEVVRLDQNGKRVVTFLGTAEKSVIERFSEGRELVPIGRKGDRFITDQLRVDFLGRHTIPSGFRSGLRCLCTYLAENSGGRLLPADARNLLRPFLQ